MTSPSVVVIIVYNCVEHVYTYVYDKYISIIVLIYKSP